MQLARIRPLKLGHHPPTPPPQKKGRISIIRGAEKGTAPPKWAAGQASKNLAGGPFTHSLCSRNWICPPPPSISRVYVFNLFLTVLTNRNVQCTL